MNTRNYFRFPRIILFALLLLQTSYVFPLTSSQQNEDFILPQRGVCAHRGATESHPENTIAAFKEAVRLGAQMIEFDVRMSKDGKLIIMHDATVDRTTNGTGLVEDLTWEEIKILDAGSWKSDEFEGERVPLLDEVLDVFPKTIWLNVHLKGNKKLGAAVAKTILDKNRTHQAIVACNSASAKGVREVNAGIKMCNMERTRKRKKYIKKTVKGNFTALQLLAKRDDIHFVNDIDELKRHNVKINYFYTNTPEEGVALLKKGVDFVLTDQLAKMLDAAEAIGIKKSL